MLLLPIFERHVDLIGADCLKKLQHSSVLIAGVGGLGSTVAQLLVRTGIGRIHLVDHDVVDETNLNRQLLYSSRDIGRPKVEVASRKLVEINPHVRITAHNELINPDFSMPDVDLVIDCLDSFSARFALDELAEEADVPLVHGGVARFHGQVTVIKYTITQTLRELFENMEDSGLVQVYPPTVAIVGAIQASEAVKLICDIGEPLVNKLLLVDVLNNTMDVIDLQ